MLQPNPEFILEIGKYPGFLPEDKDLCFKVVEPLLLYCLKNTAPLLWDGTSFYNNATDGSLSFLEGFITEHRKDRLPPGLLIPIHKSHDSLGIFYLWHGNKSHLAMQQLITLQPSIIMLAIYTYNAVIRTLNSQQRTDITLTPREYQCLALCYHGKSYKEISQQLGIAERTVIFHITNLFEKLGAHNKIEAINKAQHFGLIDIPIAS